jgi:hypothetical protein
MKNKFSTLFLGLIACVSCQDSSILNETTKVHQESQSDLQAGMQRVVPNTKKINTILCIKSLLHYV